MFQAQETLFREHRVRKADTTGDGLCHVPVALATFRVTTRHSQTRGGPADRPGAAGTTGILSLGG